MPERRRVSRKVAGILGVAVVITATIVGWKFGMFGTRSWRLAIQHGGPDADRCDELVGRPHTGLAGR